MEQTISAVERDIALLTEKQQQCADLIKQLSGYIPTDKFELALSVASVKVITLDIREDDVNFAMSFFMAWHTMYAKQIKEARQRLAVLRCGAGLAGIQL